MTRFLATDASRVLVSLVAALLFSATCVAGAIGPAHAADIAARPAGATGALTF